MEPSKIGTAITRLPRLISEIRLDRPNTGHDNGECGPQSHSAPPPVFGSLPRLISAVVLEYARLVSQARPTMVSQARPTMAVTK